jgi:hypothetical protein
LVDAKLAYAAAQGLGVSEIAAGQPVYPNVDPRPGARQPINRLLTGLIA